MLMLTFVIVEINEHQQKSKFVWKKFIIKNLTCIIESFVNDFY
jgi:hypothetical protein